MNFEKKSVSVNGGAMAVHLARPAGGAKAPAMVVFQEAFGVNDHIRDVAARFVERGFVAAAPELFHRTAAGFEGSYGDFEAIRPHMAALSHDGLIADAKAAFELLQSDPQVDAQRIACIGFCMGGRVSFLANAALPLRAAISFYGGGIVPDGLDRAAQQHGPLLMFWGGQDKHIGPDQYRALADALTQAQKTHEQVLFSQADHGFFCDRRPSYHEAAARQAWALTLEFLRVNGAAA